MSQDPEAIRHFRNFVIITFLIIFIFLLCGYFTSILIIFSVDPDIRILKYITAPIKEQIIIIPKTVLIYWDYYIKNYEILTYSSHAFFVPKLLASTFLPYLMLLSLIFTFRAPLMDWRPFKKIESIHGSSKWATPRKVKKMGLRAKHGVLLGRYNKKFLIADGFQHILLFAPTGSGKGVGFVIPNLLFWQDSVIVHDIKLENYEFTSGWRRHHLKQKTFLWNPADPDGITHCYNPMDWISNKPGKMVDDVQKIASFLLPKQEFWENEGRSLLVGVMLYLCAKNTGKLRTLGEVVRTLRNDDVVYNFAVILDTMGKDIHPVSYMNIAAYLQKPDKERGSVTSTANSSLELWANPLVDTATATSDFNLHKFKKDPHTLYIGVTPDNIHRLKPLMGMFYQQASSIFTAKMPRPEEKYGILMMMDEFPTLGKLEQFQAGIAYFRGYRVRLFLIIQDTQQLKGIYEESGMNSFLSNSTYRITFAANNMETANLISQLLGNKTATQVSYNKPKYLDLNPGARSLHVSHVQRALLLPQEVIQLPEDDQIILIESQPPIKSKKIKYYNDRFFKRRLLKQIKIPTQKPFLPDFTANKKQQDEEKKKREDNKGEKTEKKQENTPAEKQEAISSE